MKKAFLTIAAMGALLATGGCAIFGSSDGSGGPDEFRVVTKAPLSVPPEYSLRPPAAGTSIPAEADLARAPVAAFGTTLGADASAAERALVAAAGANAINPMIRSVVDFEEAGTIRKSRDSADTVLSSREDGAVDDSATGNAPVTIARGSGERTKLPGT